MVTDTLTQLIPLPLLNIFFHIKSENLTVPEREICCACDYQRLYGTSTHRITKSMEFIFKDYYYVNCIMLFDSNANLKQWIP